MEPTCGNFKDSRMTELQKESEKQPEQHSNRVIQQQLAEVLKRLSSVEKRLTDLERETKRVKRDEEETETEETNKFEWCSNFESSLCDRIILNGTEIPEDDRPENHNQENDVQARSRSKEGLHNKTMLWHTRMGHASAHYLKQLQKKFPETVELHETEFDDASLDCDVCTISRINRVPFKPTGERAQEPLQTIHFDIMGMINPAAYPKQYKYISVFTDDYSRLTMAYPMKTKGESGHYFELFVKSARKLLNRDAKVCRLISYQKSEFSEDYMAEVLETLGVELQFGGFEAPLYNKIFNHSIQKKVRVLMYDSGLPENMWDLALGSAVYAHNRTPHSANEMKTPFEAFNPKYPSPDLTRLRRFGCLAYAKVQRKMNQKYRFIIKRLILVGYKESGYILLNPEDGKFYVTREVRFNEKMVFADKYKRTSVKNWENVNIEIDTDKWFIDFEKEEQESENQEETSTNYNKRGREW